MGPEPSYKWSYGAPMYGQKLMGNKGYNPTYRGLFHPI